MLQSFIHTAVMLTLCGDCNASHYANGEHIPSRSFRTEWQLPGSNDRRQYLLDEQHQTKGSDKNGKGLRLIPTLIAAGGLRVVSCLLLSICKYGRHQYCRLRRRKLYQTMSEKGADSLRRFQKNNQCDSPPNGQAPFQLHLRPAPQPEYRQLSTAIDQITSSIVKITNELKMSIENKKSLKAEESRPERSLDGEHYATVQWLRETLFAIGKQVDDAVRSVDEVSRNDSMLLADGKCRGAFVRMSNSLVSAIEHFHEAFALVGQGSITAERPRAKAIGVEEKKISREPKSPVQARGKIDLMIEEQYFIGVQLEVPSASLPRPVGHRHLLQIEKAPVMGCAPIVMDDWSQADKRHGFAGIAASGARAIPR